MWAEEGVEEGWGRVGRDRAGRVSGSNGAEVEGERTILLYLHEHENEGRKEGWKEGKQNMSPYT